MRVAIVGSRGFKHLDLVRLYVKSLPLDAVVVSGGAPGVDRTAEWAARDLGMDVTLWLPDYTKHSKRAPLVRNGLIAEDADQMRAFHDGTSTGTLHALTCMLQLDRPAWICDDSGELNWRRYG